TVPAASSRPQRPGSVLAGVTVIGAAGPAGAGAGSGRTTGGGGPGRAGGAGRGGGAGRAAGAPGTGGRGPRGGPGTGRGPGGGAGVVDAGGGAGTAAFAWSAPVRAVPVWAVPVWADSVRSAAEAVAEASSPAPGSAPAPAPGSAGTTCVWFEARSSTGSGVPLPWCSDTVDLLAPARRSRDGRPARGGGAVHSAAAGPTEPVAFRDSNSSPARPEQPGRALRSGRPVGVAQRCRL